MRAQPEPEKKTCGLSSGWIRWVSIRVGSTQTRISFFFFFFSQVEPEQTCNPVHPVRVVPLTLAVIKVSFNTSIKQYAVMGK